MRWRVLDGLFEVTDQPVDNLKQRQKFMDLIGEGPVRRIHLAALSALVISGIAIQGAVWWYSIQAANRAWSMAGILVCAFAAGILALAVGLLLAPLWKR